MCLISAVSPEGRGGVTGPQARPDVFQRRAQSAIAAIPGRSNAEQFVWQSLWKDVEAALDHIEDELFANLVSQRNCGP